MEPDTIAELLRRLRASSIRVPIRSRQGGGVGDPATLEAARITYERNKPRFPLDPNVPYAIAVAPALEEFDFEKAQPVPASSNVDAGYFVSYSPNIAVSASRGDLYLVFQKRRPETPEGKPIGPQRAYVYQNVPGFIWEAIQTGASPGGQVWDLLRRSGFIGDKI